MILKLLAGIGLITVCLLLFALVYIGLQLIDRDGP